MPNAISNAILNLSASLDYEQHLSVSWDLDGAVMENHYNWSDWPFEAKKIIHMKEIMNAESR